MKRIYNDDGFWTEDASSGVRIVEPHIKAAFAALEAAGFNPREAGLLIEDEARTIAVEKMIDRRAKT